MIKNLKIKESTRLLCDNFIGHLSFIALGSPYVIPITYYYDQTNNCILSYSGEGHKIDAMRVNDTVSLEVEEIESVKNWQSVLVHGLFEELKGFDAKHLLHEFAKGVKSVMERRGEKEPKFICDFSSKIPSEKIPVVYRIKILEITGKLRKPSS